MSKKNNIFLIGGMGSGKTSVGLSLAKKSKKKFYDSDSEIEARTGVSISWIFEVEKEAGFRQRETKALEELCQLDDIILSTGGGCILADINRKYLKENGLIVYLKVSLPEQLRRTTLRKGIRPLVDVPNPEERLIQLHQIRDPLYLEIADLVYETDDSTPAEIANKIYSDIKKL